MGDSRTRRGDSKAPDGQHSTGMSQGRGPGQYARFAIRTDLPANARGLLRGGVVTVLLTRLLTVLTPPRVRYVSSVRRNRPH
eukprot:3638072-Prymnesium_polylepis.1